MLNITPEEKKSLKSRGYIMIRDDEHFIARVITIDGLLTADELDCIAEASRKFGDGRVALTSRLTAEVQGLTYDTIEEFDKFIAKAGLYTGGTSSRVRPIVACKGTVCVHGLVDTQELARELHETFYKGWYDVKLPHKFKIGIGGCPNNCIKPALNDFGIMGQSVPAYDEDLCNGCKKCSVVDVCPVKAATTNEDGLLEIDPKLCNNCGKCVGACRYDSIEEAKRGYRLMVGGLWGKRQRIATELDGVYTREEVFTIIEKTLLIYREQGQTGERFGAFLDRTGVDSFIAQLKTDDILTRKQEILDAKLHLVGGATC